MTINDTRTPGDDEDIEERHDLEQPDDLGPLDLTGLVDLGPLLSEEEYDQEVAAFVAESAPELFAVFCDYGEEADGEITAWGLQFHGHAEVVTLDGRMHMRLVSAERALRAFARQPGVTPRLVWISPGPAAQTN